MLNLVVNYQMKTSTTLSKITFYFTGIFSIFLFWIVLSSTKNNNFIYPSLGMIFKSLINLFWDYNIFFATVNSFLKVIIVLLISFFISIIISFIYILKKDTIEFFKPWLALLKATPLAIISVYLWISLGSEKAPYLITLLMTLPICVQGFISSLNQIDIIYINQLKTEDVSIFKKFYKIYLPLILPYIIMTLLQTFGMGIKVVLMAEYICQSKNSLGNYIYLFNQNIEFDKLLALLIFIVFIVLIIELIINKISKKLTKNV